MADVRKVKIFKAFKRLSIVLGACVFLSCGGPAPCESDDPCDVVKFFLTSADAQANEYVWKCLSGKTQAALEARAEAFNKAHAGQHRRGFDMIRAGHVMSSTREYKKFELASQNDDSASVDIIKHDGSKLTIVLHREDNRWAMDLPLSDLDSRTPKRAGEE